MNLTTYYDQLPHPKTDKGTIHNYINGYYNNIFSPLRYEKIKLLEIGAREGYSFNLWRSWFNEAEITCFDLPKWSHTIQYINKQDNSKGFVQDAFTAEALDAVSGELFDFIIEDGPHTVNTQLFAAQKWIHKLNVNGKLIIEDIQSPENDVDVIIADLKNNLNYKVELFDLRQDKSRYDDYIIEVTRLK